MDQISRALLTVGGGVAAPTYVDDVFATYLYTGNGSTQTINNGIDLAGKGGMVWVKNRDGAFNHRLVDTERGGNNVLYSNLTNAQETDDSINTFSSTGFNVGLNIANNANKYVTWTFRKAPKFFDMVTYTGNGTTVQTINHSLGTAPGLMIVKALGSAVNPNWFVYSNALGPTKGFYLTLTNAEATNSSLWNNTSPTSSQFTVGSFATESGISYVAYLFAHDTSSEGLIQCGSYTGNGSTTGPNITLGWEPQFILIKKATDSYYGGGSNWYLFDNMRGIPTGSSDSVLYANTAGTETTEGLVDVTSTGFIITSSSYLINFGGTTVTNWTHSYTTTAPISYQTGDRGTPAVYSVADTTANNSVSPCFVFGPFGNTAAGNWIGYDLGTSQSVDTATYRNTASSIHAPTSVLVQYSTDNVNWTTATSYSDDGSTSVQTITFGSTSARYWRLYQNSTTRANSTGYEWHFNNVRFKGGGTDKLVVTGSSSSSNTNYSADTYIYMAIRRPNKPPTGAAQIFTPITKTGDFPTATISEIGFHPDAIFCSAVSGTYGGQSLYSNRFAGSLQGLASSSQFLQTHLTSVENPTGSIRWDGATFSQGTGWGSTKFSWLFFKRAPGFFDVVCYTGNSNTQFASQTITHNLGVKPELIITKARSATTSGQWMVGTAFTASNQRLGYLHLNNSVGTFSYGAAYGAEPTAASFSVINQLAAPYANNTNESGVTYVSYLFASLPGISKVGTYTGNGSSQTINCGFTTGARFVLIKRTDSAGDWYVWDTARGIVSANDPHLSLNTTAAEVTSNDSIDPDNTGFIVNQVADTNINVTSATYIYLAIA